MATRPRNVRRIAVPLALFALLLAPSLHASHPVSVLNGPQFQSLGVGAMEDSLFRDGLYAETAQTQAFRVDQQMIAVLALLRSATLRPDDRTELHERAFQVWQGAQAAYDPIGQYYHLVVPAPDRSVCISVEVQGWALRATRALQTSGVGNGSLAAQRVTEGRATIMNLLDQRAHQGQPACLDRDKDPVISVLALVEARTSASDTRVERIIPDVANQIVARFEDGALPNKNIGLYDPALNAQILWMLVEVTRVFPTSTLIKAREGLVNFLLNETIETTPQGPVARNVRTVGTSFSHEGEPQPADQVWLAYVLNHYESVHPNRVPAGLVTGLMTVFFERFWSPADGAFKGRDELVSFETNALAALVSSSPIVMAISTEASEFAIAVPAKAFMDYTVTENAGATLTNDWHIRFQLATDRAGAVESLLTSRDLDSFQFDQTGDLKLFRLTSTARLPLDNVRLYEGKAEVMRFSTDLTTSPIGFRLEGSTPVKAIQGSFDNRIRIVLDNTGVDPIPLRTLRFEISATDIKIDSVKINQQNVANPEVITPVTTEDVREPHTRLLIRDVVLPAGQSEILLEYTDIQPPRIHAHAISRDERGRDVIEASPTGIALQGEPLYVRAVVRDNAVLRGVLLRYQFDQEVVERPMVEGDAGVFTYPIPQTNETGTFQWQVVAIDAASNLNQTAARFVQIENPLLSGSRVLFAFSGTLFLSAVIIWFKVRRKAA